LCHALIADKFAQSPHKVAFDEAGYPECEICHSNHLIVEPREYWIGATDSSLCIDCHSDNDGTIGLETARRIYSSLVNLKEKYNLAAVQISEADEKGMLVTDENFLLKEIEQAIIKARTMVHTFNGDSVEAITEPAGVKADSAYAAGMAKIDEYYFRRQGLGVASLIITILVIALYLKMRRREKVSQS
jgi:predicted CXXCH cytochrome family protein